jgi:Na+/H+-dicarboxylate symporter
MHKSMNICEEKLNISPTVARFSIPFFTTLKSDGSIMFITVATIFLAKYNNYMIEFQQYILILFMTCTICLSSPPG